MKTWHPSPVPARHRVGFRQGVVSNGVPLDEDPVCSFPCNPFELMPPEAYADIRVAIEFMSRYREFWGPGNMLWCDRQRNAVAVEKTNCRVAFRFPVVAGAVGVTACAYLDPELHAFKQKCLRKVMKAKRESQRNNMDWHFDQGSRLRYQRLMNLTQREAARPGGATLWGAFDIVADEAVPFPARICLAGQKVMPDQPGREQHVNWTVSQHAGVITGPRRRWLCRAIRDTAHPRAVTRWTPRLVLGEGVRMRREWQADITAERCELAGKEGTP